MSWRSCHTDSTRPTRRVTHTTEGRRTTSAGDSCPGDSGRTWGSSWNTPAYTGGVVRRRSFALVLALVVAATPVIGLVCAMDCDQPPAASAPCHDESVSHGGLTLRGTSHACDHDHTGASPALLAGSSARDSVGTSVEVGSPTLVHALLSEAHTAAAGAMHGPPVLNARSTSSHITVLRI